MFLKVKGKTGSSGDWWTFECYKIHYHNERLDGSGNKRISSCKVVRQYYTEGHPVNSESGSSDLREEDWFEWKDFEWDVCILKDDPQCNPRPVMVAHLGAGDNQEYIIVFDTVAYLCNDKGETIEKIEP